MYFWESNSERYFLREEFLINSLGNWLKLVSTIDNCLKWFLINVVIILCFFIKVFTTSKTFLILTYLNSNLELLITGCNEARYLSRGTSLECFPPIGKSTASLGKASRHLVINGIAWCPVSHASATQWGVGNQRSPNWLCWVRGGLKNWMPKQLVSKK